MQINREMPQVFGSKCLVQVFILVSVIYGTVLNFTLEVNDKKKNF